MPIWIASFIRNICDVVWGRSLHVAAQSEAMPMYVVQILVQFKEIGKKNGIWYKSFIDLLI